MYDEFSSDYDRFVNWPGRLAVETPFLEQQLEASGARDVLDTACGTGMHAIALGSRGYRVTGADGSSGMVAVCRANAERAEVPVVFVEAAFGGHADVVGGQFDAVLCLGNSLPHVLTVDDLDAALADFRACLRPGGIVIIQSRNFDSVLEQGSRWMGPQGHDEDGTERVFVRFYDFDPDGLLTFNVLTLQRSPSSEWKQRVSAARLWPQRRADIEAALQRAGFERWTWFGDLQGSPFEPSRSTNLVVVARNGRAAPEAAAAQLD